MIQTKKEFATSRFFLVAGKVRRRNEQCKKICLSHPDLILLPIQRSGRLFPYSHRKAGNKINPILNEMFNIPLKKVHWFRRTFKILYRDEGVDEKAIDALVGHAEGDASRKAYAGVEYLDVLRCCVEISIRG